MELKSVLKELSKGYEGEVAINWNVCKAELITQLKDMVTAAVNSNLESDFKAPLHLNRVVLKRKADDSSDVFLKRHTRGGEWVCSFFFLHLTSIVRTKKNVEAAHVNLL